MSTEELKNHPMYNSFVNNFGEKRAISMLSTLIEEQRKENQATAEFSDTEKKIVIPRSMNKLQASEELQRQWKDEESVINISRAFDGWNWKDVLVAVKKVSEDYFGWINGKTIRTFFGTKRPSEIDIITDIRDGKKHTETCFYGQMEISSWDSATVDVGPSSISVQVKKRFSSNVRDYLNKIQEYLDTSSIYRGKPVTITKNESPWGEVSLEFELFEMKVSDKIILNEDVEGIVSNFIEDDLGEEGKRTYLFSGGYGNGKTETAMRVGSKGLNKSMSFFYCKDADVFSQLLQQAVNYQPCIIFLEDIDEIGSGEKRDASMNRILNTLDGVQTKGNNITVIFTTNHENRINKALRRPGRIDLVIKFSNPEPNAVKEIYRSYLEEFDPNERKFDYEELAKITPDVSGAVIAEIAKRAVKLCRKKGTKCNNSTIKSAINSMRHHIELMEEPIETPELGEVAISIQGAKIGVESLRKGSPSHTTSVNKYLEKSQAK